VDDTLSGLVLYYNWVRRRTFKGLHTPVQTAWSQILKEK
jgi:hypothetical protein